MGKLIQNLSSVDVTAISPLDRVPVWSANALEERQASYEYLQGPRGKARLLNPIVVDMAGATAADIVFETYDDDNWDGGPFTYDSGTGILTVNHDCALYFEFDFSLQTAEGTVTNAQWQVQIVGSGDSGATWDVGRTWWYPANLAMESGVGELDLSYSASFSNAFSSGYQIKFRAYNGHATRDLYFQLGELTWRAVLVN